MADILDLVDVEELRNEVQKKYRAVAEKPEASSGYDRAILDQLREEACEAFAGRRPRPPGRGSAFLSSLGPSRVRDSNREQPLRHSHPTPSGLPRDSGRSYSLNIHRDSGRS